MPSCRYPGESEDKAEEARRRKILPLSHRHNVIARVWLAFLAFLRSSNPFMLGGAFPIARLTFEQPLLTSCGVADDERVVQTQQGGAKGFLGINTNYASLTSYDVFPSAINISLSNVPVYSNIPLPRPTGCRMSPLSPPSCHRSGQERAAILRSTRRTSDRPDPSIFDFPSKINGWT